MAARVLVGFPTSAGIGVGPVVGPGRKGVVVAADLDPAEVMSLDTAAVTAVVTAAGAPLSHAAILVRSLGLPAVTGLGPQLLALAPGTVILVDGDAGTVIVDPTNDELGAAEDRRRATRQKRDEDGLRAHAPAITRDGHAVSVLANVGSVEDAEAAVRGGADGVGMLRTEFVFLNRSEPPGEHEQYDAYCRVAEALGDRPLVIRTLDLGADIPAWGAPPEPNPALGNRGIRFSLSFPEVLETQLRAVARLALQRPVRVMFPMVTTVDELRRARACLDDVTRGSPAGAAAPAIEVGTTVEVPAAALTAETFVPLVEFFGVGTNDLTQYTLAVDRTNAAVAGITDGLHPAVLRLVREVAAAGARHGRPVCVVGELGTDPLAIPVLLGLGVATWSVRANAIAAVKEVVRQVRLDEARVLAEAALGAESAPAVRELVARRWAVVTGQA